MKKISFLFLFLVQVSFANDMVWSKTGHRTIGLVAEEHLTRKTKKALRKLLNGESLAEVANFADEIKSDRKYREFSAWHYVNFAADAKYGDAKPSEDGDIITGIEKCISIIKSEASSPEDKSFYLKMLIHLIGDLHQPLHVGRLEDRGGNDIQVQWFDNGSNLHRVWDSNMINQYGMSYSELAESLPRISKKQEKAIQEGTVLDWAEESQEIANKIYDSVEVGEKLRYRYNYLWWETLEKQLQKGGLRLAQVLNSIF